MDNPIRVGVSACLLGQPTRYDGGHKHDRYLTDTLGRFFTFVPVCPEVESGLPVPREAMRLVGDPERPRLVGVQSGQDFTERLETFSARRVEELAGEDLLGFIFKSKSPSSGMARVKVYGEKGSPVIKGVGLFARAFMARFPLTPVEEEGRLNDPGLRENFIERVFALARLRELLSAPDHGQRDFVSRLSAFQAAHKLQVLSHSPALARELGAIAAGAKAAPIEAVAADYTRVFMTALSRPATRARQVNTLEHALGHFKKLLTTDEKAEMLEIVGHYRQGLVPLIAPITLLKHYTRKYALAWLGEQTYLAPHPIELALRNHV